MKLGKSADVTKKLEEVKIVEDDWGFVNEDHLNSNLTSETSLNI